jgi:hypothetical protein
MQVFEIIVKRLLLKPHYSIIEFDYIMALYEQVLHVTLILKITGSIQMNFSTCMSVDHNKRSTYKVHNSHKDFSET